MPKAKSVDDYLAAQPKTSQRVLKKVRAIIRRVVPKADESISYQIPAYKIEGELVIFFAGWSDTFSLYPATGSMNELLGDKLKPYKVAKGTLKFSLTDPIPEKLIERIVKIRANEALMRVTQRGAKPRTGLARSEVGRVNRSERPYSW